MNLILPSIVYSYLPNDALILKTPVTVSLQITLMYRDLKASCAMKEVLIFQVFIKS